MAQHRSQPDDHAIVRFARELRRRKVLRTGALYVIGAWLVLQVADVLFPGFGIPEAAIQALVWTAIAGFPLALIFGWFFDISPTGIRRTLPASAANVGQAPSLGRGDYAILTAFLLVAGLLVYNATEKVLETPGDPVADARPPLPMEPAPEKLENSVAVLPFDNISSDPDNEFFCDGMSDEILHRLSAFRELNVIGRTSSFAFKGSKYAVPRISHILGVRYVLQGSVRKQGDELRIAAQLLDEDGRQIWSQTFDRELRNVFDVQSEISVAVARTVASHVVPPSTDVEPPGIEAYELYVTGREWLMRRDWTRARLALEEAISLDADFAEAHAELAIALLAIEPSRDDIAYARRHVEHAQRLKPELLRARVAQALALLAAQPPDAIGAEQILRDVLDQDPNMSDALLWLGGLLDDEERLAMLQRAYRIDPLHPSISGSLAQELVDRGKLEEAVRLLERQLEQPKPGYTAIVKLADIYKASARLVDMNRIAKSLALRLAGPHYLYLALNYAVLGHWSAASYWLERSARDFPTARMVPFQPTILPGWQGDYAAAVGLFEEALATHGLQLADQGPSFSFWLGALLARAGEHRRVIDLLEGLVNPDGHLGSAFTFGTIWLDGAHALAWSYLRTGRDRDAQPIVGGIARHCLDLQREETLHASDLLHYCAENALLQGDEDRALSLLEEAVKAGWRDYYIRVHDPYWASLGENPRYRELMAFVQADVDRQRAEVERMDAEGDFVERLDAIMTARARDADTAP